MEFFTAHHLIVCGEAPLPNAKAVANEGQR